MKRLVLIVSLLVLPACGAETAEGTSNASPADAAPSDAGGTTSDTDPSDDTAVVPPTDVEPADASTQDAAADEDAADAATDDTGAPDTSAPACPPPSVNRPSALSEHAGVFDPIKERIIFHGGNPAFPVQCIGKNTFVGETWAYWPRCKTWERIDGAGPGPRGRASAVYDPVGHAMIMFGGRYRSEAAGSFAPYTLYAETWRFDLATDTWTQLQAKGDVPPARVSAAAVYDPQNHRMVLFGGNASTSGASYVALADTYSFDINSATWTKLTTTGTPAARLFGAAVYDSKRHAMIITQGGDNNAFLGPFLGDTWALDLKTLTWNRLHAGTANPRPDARIWGRAVYVPSTDRLVLFGGHDDGTLGNRNDLWTFDIDKRAWTLVQANDTWNKPALGQCDFPADFANVVEGTPERRGAHMMVLWEKENAILVSGGKTDCGLVDDVWRLDLGTWAWTGLDAASVGEVCLRYSDSCKSLCN